MLMPPSPRLRSPTAPVPIDALAKTARGDWHGLKSALPVPAGGMTTDRVAEMLEFYGPDTMLLIGDALLSARERLTEETRRFVGTVKAHRYG